MVQEREALITERDALAFRQLQASQATARDIVHLSLQVCVYVCVCMRARACVCACVHACVCVCDSLVSPILCRLTPLRVL